MSPHGWPRLLGRSSAKSLGRTTRRGSGWARRASLLLRQCRRAQRSSEDSGIRGSGQLCLLRGVCVAQFLGACPPRGLSRWVELVFTLGSCSTSPCQCHSKQESEEPAFWGVVRSPHGPGAGSRSTLGAVPADCWSLTRPGLRAGSGQETLAKLLAEAALQEGAHGGVSHTAATPRGSVSSQGERSEESVPGREGSGGSPRRCLGKVSNCQKRRQHKARKVFYSRN